ncbi:pyruvate kinase [candidate division FCPU426 bacterium]|nr:pyruvate kinase [candidate division FCPU426 bacterium]
MQRTKMVFTLGPATDRPGVLEKLIHLGMDCARLNFSHGTQAEHARRYYQLRSAARRMGCPVAVMMDLAGPKLRVRSFQQGGISLKARTIVRLTPRPVLGSAGIIPISYKNLAKDIHLGDPVLLDDGLIRLRVVKKEKNDVLCRVENGGLLRDHKGMNLPGLAVKVPALTVKDKKDLAFGVKLGVDYIALSFVREAEEMLRLRHFIRRAGGGAGTVAKIEKPQAIPRLEDIIQAADGLMIARGDLGVELSAEEVPVLQKRIITLANHYGRFVITATQMLQSMMASPVPTRAEATDVANAVFDGTDAVMLSGETAAGLYPVKAAAIMARIGSSAEKAPEYNRLHLQPAVVSAEDEVVAAAVKLAEKVKAKVMVVYTHTGRTARLVSRQRPSVPVYALVHAAEVQRQLQLNWGIQTALVKDRPVLENAGKKAGAYLLQRRIVNQGDRVVVLASSPRGTRTNFIKVHVIGAK